MGHHVKLSSNGRISIPADVRAKLGMKNGDTLLLRHDGSGITLTTLEQSVREAQSMIAQAMEGKPGFTVDDFIRERREEARREEEKDRLLHGG